MTKGIHKDSLWTEERIEKLKIWWADGVSGKNIAAQFDCGLTRNAVIGKVHRLGLPERPTKKNTLYPKRKRRTPKRSNILAGTIAGSFPMKKIPEIVIPKEAPEPINGTGIDLFQLTNSTCKYGLGGISAKADFFCGLPTFGESRFCLYHHSICYNLKNKTLEKTVVTLQP